MKHSWTSDKKAFTFREGHALYFGLLSLYSMQVRLVWDGAFLACGVTWTNQSDTVVRFPLDDSTELRLRKLRDTQSTRHVNTAWEAVLFLSCSQTTAVAAQQQSYATSRNTNDKYLSHLSNLMHVRKIFRRESFCRCLAWQILTSQIAKRLN